MLSSRRRMRHSVCSLNKVCMSPKSKVETLALFTARISSPAFSPTQHTQMRIRSTFNTKPEFTIWVKSTRILAKCLYLSLDQTLIAKIGALNQKLNYQVANIIHYNVSPNVAWLMCNIWVKKHAWKRFYTVIMNVTLSERQTLWIHLTHVDVTPPQTIHMACHCESFTHTYTHIHVRDVLFTGWDPNPTVNWSFNNIWAHALCTS